MSIGVAGPGSPEDVIYLNGNPYQLRTLPGRPTLINLTPQRAFGQVTVIGDTAKRRDQRKSSMPVGDQTLGQGEDTYTETEGIRTFRESDWDTRWPGALALRPKPTQLGSALPVGKGGQGTRVFHVGYTNMSRLLYPWGGEGFRYSGGAWTALSGGPLATIYGHCRALGRLYVNDGDQVWRTTDGTTWGGLGTTGLPANRNIIGPAMHDGKLWIAATDNATGLATLYATANPTTGAATWEAKGAAYLEPNVEFMRELLLWRDAADRRAVYLLTTLRLYGHDDDARVLQPVQDWAGEGSSPATGYVWPATDALYTARSGRDDYVEELTGTQKNKLGPNARGGLTKARQGSPWAIAGDGAHLFGCFSPGAFIAPTLGKGQVACWRNGGWHTLYRDLAGSLSVVGGGAGDGKLWSVMSDRTVWEQDLTNPYALPYHAEGRRYDTAASGCWHQSAETDLGTELLPELVTGFVVDLLKSSDGTRGLDANTAVKVEYRIDRGAWQGATQARIGGANVALTGGQITPAQVAAYPVELLVNGGLGTACRELAWRVRGTTTDDTVSPVLRSIAPKYLHRPGLAFDLEFAIDLLAAAEEGPLSPWLGRTAGEMRDELLALGAQDELFEVRYAVNGKERVIEAAEFAIAPTEEVNLGIGVYRCVVRDQTSADSG